MTVEEMLLFHYYIEAYNRMIDKPVYKNVVWYVEAASDLYYYKDDYKILKDNAEKTTSRVQVMQKLFFPNNIRISNSPRSLDILSHLQLAKGVNP